ncbi:MAG: hypothetical protein ABJB05_04910 [Parafilimonas sp.]
MIKIKQTNYLQTDAFCLAASLASILENRMEDYPPLQSVENWYVSVNNYLHTLGYNLVVIEKPHASALFGYHLIIGTDEVTGKMHCVVGKDGTIIHDPCAIRNKHALLHNIFYGIISKVFL